MGYHDKQTIKHRQSITPPIFIYKTEANGLENEVIAL